MPKKSQCRMPDIISQVQELTGLNRRDSKVAIQAVIYAIKLGVTQTQQVRIPGFGKFVKIHKDKSLRKSFGKMTEIPAKDIVKFRPLKAMKQLVNKEIQMEKFSADMPEDD